MADAGAGTGGPAARLTGLSEESPDGEPGEVLAGVTGGADVPAGLR